MIHTAIRAARNNIDTYVSAKDDPVMFNVNVALLNIAKTLLKLQCQLDDIQQCLKKPETNRACESPLQKKSSRLVNSK